MRKIALAAVIAAGLVALPTAATAQTYTDPDGRITFETPRGWTVDRQNSPNQTVVLMFNARNDCYLFGIPNPRTADASPSAVVRSTSTQIGADAWTSAANSITDFFPNNSAQLVSQSVETSGFWPVQRAEFSNGSKTVFGALTLRPGFDLMAFCAATSGGSAEAYDSLFRSLGHPNDDQWEASAPAGQ